MGEGTTSMVTAADRPYGEFYDFYSVSPENFGSTLVFIGVFLLRLCYTTHQVYLMKPHVGGTNRQLASTCEPFCS